MNCKRFNTRAALLKRGKTCKAQRAGKKQINKMKKTMICVSAIMALAVGTMFVACKSNGPVDGCTCTFVEDGETTTHSVNSAEMMGYGATTCSGYASAIQGAHAAHGRKVSVSCR